MLVTGGTDRLVQVWEMPGGALLRTLGGHGAGVTCGALSPDGKVLVSGSWDRTIRIWDVASAKTIGILKGHTDAVNAVALSPDGKTIASGGADRVFRLWDVAARELKFASPEQELNVTSVQYSPDGTLLVTGTGDWKEWKKPGEVKLWNSATGEELASLPGHTAQVNVAEFSPDGKLLATGCADTHLRIYDVAARRLLTDSTTGQGVRRIAWFPDGQRLALGQHPGRVGIWSLKAAGMKAVYAGHEKVVYAVAVTPDSTAIISAATDGAVMVWTVPGKE